MGGEQGDTVFVVSGEESKVTVCLLCQGGEQVDTVFVVSGEESKVTLCLLFHGRRAR